ncbi:leucine-rich repeat flightless-interacting protein 2 isoform X7 [Hippoglossus stenolepis]|uniref:leucine-rich repeat flightless-interacting protein 2 isoform X7 n=1 Tax=Hippoglossus stenolepis TaxID=195615 RepID=UPI00159CB8C0|nr:leucine-rich repeat flightless-interacting protein 2 isoform X7 [Hippoglossus stenolepis]
MGTQGAGRKRSSKREKTTAEDDALNLVAREAEARLAAKRAARAEAREIRMKELERQQKEIFQVQKKYYGLNTKFDEPVDNRWGDIEQWMEDSERYSRSSQITRLSDDDERMSVGSRGSVRSPLDAVGAYAGGGASLKKPKKKKKHKHKDKDGNGNDDDHSVVSSRSSRLSDESRVSRGSKLDLTSSRLSDESRLSRASRSELQPSSFASSDLYGLNGLSSSRNAGSAFNGYQSHVQNSLYEDSICSGSRRLTGSSSHPLDYTSYRSSGSRASSRAGSARASPVDNCSSVASYLRSAAGGSGLHRDLDDVTIPDFSDVSLSAPTGGRGWDVEDRDYLEKGSRAASALTATTLPSLGGTSSRRGSGETSLTVDAETSIREIKDTLSEVEEKYRKAMVSNAQLDNEKNNYMYQVDTLKDSLMELEELLSESNRGYEEKVKDFEREKHAHGVLQFQFSEMKETLKQSEELLNKHGIVLGPDLSVNGDIGEADVDGSSSGDAAQQPAQDSQTTEGNSMLGNTEETEEVDPDQHPDILKEEAKENQLSSDKLCDAAVSTMETSAAAEEQPTDEQQTVDESTGGSDISKDLNVDTPDHPVTEAKDIIVTSAEENSPDTETTTEIRLRKLVDEREKMIEQVKKLKAQLEQKSPKNGTDSGSSPDGEVLENGNDPNILEVQRDSSRQMSDLKFKLVKAEQEVTALEQNVTRLEGQVTRYKSAAENAEKVEDELKAEKRKLQRELRSSLDKVEELESSNSHLSKRMEKMKSTRGMAQTP